MEVQFTVSWNYIEEVEQKGSIYDYFWKNGIRNKLYHAARCLWNNF